MPGAIGHKKFHNPVGVKMSNIKKLTRRQETNVRAKAQEYTSKILGQLAAQATGELTDKDGNPIEMSMAQIRASEIILKKTLPDLSMVQQVEDDPLEHMSRDEMTDMLSHILSSNPALAQLSGIQNAVDRVNTIADVTPKHLDDDDSGEPLEVTSSDEVTNGEAT